MRHTNRVLSCLSAMTALALLTASQGLAQGDLYMRDTVSDTGAEPYTGPGPVYLSPDIWVRTEPDPNFDPYPFPTASPTWTPAPHQNPEYRDSKTSRPNYVYVRIHNSGRTPSTGTERLRLYQAKASTGLGWPLSWVDNVQTACGEDLLHGIEVTKPRRNAKNVSPAERLAYRDAVIAIASDPAYRYSDAVQYFTKQNVVHTSGPEHGNPAFFPWHREMVSRYEERLREANPLVNLLYWDFTENPTTGTNLFTNDFLGASSGTVGGPLGAGLPTTISRGYPGNNCAFDSDASLLANGTYSDLRSDAEQWPNHNCAHGEIGGSGEISSPSTAVEDPFFFLLHSNVDRQWATWQRDGALPSRIDPVSAYGTDSSHARITANMRPWNGSFSVAPWTGSGITNKTSTDRSVVFPPVYDTAPLNIPILQPGESVVVEIPWYPPNVNNFNCAGQAGHFCLLARIETETSAPFGMTTAETMSVSANTTNNNNIAWKNVTIVDEVTEPAFMFLTGTTIRNFFDREAFFAIRLLDRTERRPFLLQEFADIGLVLPDELLARMAEAEGKMQDLEFAEIEGIDRKVLRVTGKEPAFRTLMKPGEAFTVEFAIRLRDDEPIRELLEEPFLFDIEQELDVPRDLFPREHKALEIGGVRFEIDIGRALKTRAERNGGDGTVDFDFDRIARLRNLRLVDLTISLQTEGQRSGLRQRGAETQHLSPGEPLEIVVGNDDPQRSMLRMTLEVDGEERAAAEGPELRETVSFETPGVHTIVTRGLTANGELEQRLVRVLVSEDIPPVTEILEPQSGQTFAVGEEIVVVAETDPAYQREIGEVTLHVKTDDLFATGMDLVSESYPAVDRSEGPGPHELTFVPQEPGHYTLQVGARDDEGNVGVSGHVMLMITE